MSFVKIILSGQYRETGIQTRGLSSAAQREGFRFDLFFLKTESIIKNKGVDKVLIECRQDFSAGSAGLEEICERINVLKNSGKEVYFYSASYSGSQLYLAASCSYRLIHPMGTLRFFGLAHSFTFAKKLLRRIGVDTEIVRRGKYKSAGDRFRTDSLDDAGKEQYGHYFSAVADFMKDGIISGFEKNEDDIKQLLEGRVLTADEAADASWIDEIVTAGEFVDRWKNEGSKEFRFKRVPEKTGSRFKFVQKQIAVLVFEGAVIDGRSRRDPLLGQAVGSESFIPQIRKLRDDKKVKAVVFRINSGGGSAFASEDITAELRLLAEKKPLIVSMSEIAGSGGYWMSCCGRKTYALPTTLTGSIGVISIYIAFKKLMEKIGLTHDTIKTGDFADIGSPLRNMTEAERTMIDSEIDNMYRSFVKMVADARGLAADEVDANAQGRIWPGMSSVDINLIDELGGLKAAIDSAAEEAGVKRPSVKFYPEVKQGLIAKLIMNFTKDDDESAEAAAFAAGMKGLLNNPGISSAPLAVTEEILYGWK